MRVRLILILGIFVFNIALSQPGDTLLPKIYSQDLPDSVRFDAILLYVRTNLARDSQYLKVLETGDSLIATGNISPRKKARFYNSKAIYLNATDCYDSARALLQESLEIFKKLGDTQGIAMSLGNIGNYYYLKGDYARCLDYFLKAQDYFYQLGDSELIAIGENNIANVYYQLKDTLSALQGYRKTFDIAQKTKNYRLLALSSLNLGSVYYLLDRRDSSIWFYRKALEYGQKSSYLNLIADAYQNLGSLFLIEGNLDSVLFYMRKALELYQRINNSAGMMSVYLDLVWYYREKGMLDSARFYLEKARELGEQINTKQMFRNFYKEKYKLDSAEGNFRDALQSYILFTKYNDSISDADVRRDIANLKSRYELQLKERENQLLKERELRQRALIKRQKIILLLGFGLIVMLLVFFIYLYRSNKLIRKINHELRLKNREVEQKNKILSQQKEQILAQNKKITEQHNLLVRQQRDLEDSIYFAADLQRAMLPDLQVLSEFFSEWFILYKPRDIVSGDFYWVKKLTGDKIFIAVGDCTGHGVPGALLSVLSMALLNETLQDGQQITAAQALDLGRKKIKESLQQNNTDDEFNHGLDIALIIYDKSQRKLNFAGAFRPLYVVHSNILSVYTGDRQPVAAYVHEAPFTDHFIDLQPGDMIYLFTDGYPDLYSWTNKKFTIARFKKLLMDIHGLTAGEQKKVLEQIMDQWKGRDKQIDDILVVGLRV